MPFKVDENLHEEVAELLRQHGHDAVTVFAQKLQGHSDDDVAARCLDEGRALISLDLDFANILTYPPENYAGIIVLRLHDRADRQQWRRYGDYFPCSQQNRSSAIYGSWTMWACAFEQAVHPARPLNKAVPSGGCDTRRRAGCARRRRGRS
jgi:predicted nuclease of predicted toxin-antitoxin system